MFVSALFLVRANVEVGLNDDWSFIRTARDLAQTGHLQYNGWSAPLIGFQAYWGALFIKLFGFSFTTARASVWVLTLLSIPVLWSLFRSADLSEPQAFFGLMAFLFSPLILPNLATFMTDIPAFLLFAAALLSAIKAWNAQRERTAIFWICATTILGLLSGSVRQIYWISGVCFLAVLALTRMRSMRGRVLIAVCIGTTLALAEAGSHWLARQPYVPADTTLQDFHDLSWQDMMSNSGNDLGRGLVGLAVLSMPFCVGLAFRRRAVWIQLLIILAAFGFTKWMAHPLPWLGNTITQYGVISSGTVSFGDKDKVLSDLAVLLLGTVGLTCAAYALWRRWGPFTITTGSGKFAALTLPFMVAYVAVLAFRATSFGLFDRYLIPLLFIAGTLALSASARINRSSWVLCAVFGLYALGTTHDHFAEGRAKLEAMQQILRAGHARNTVLGGFESDMWAQADITGYVNNEQLDYPPDAYHDADDCSGPPDTQAFWRSETPDLKGSYIVSISPLNDLQLSEFAPITYWRWLPPHKSLVYIEKANPPLICVASKN